MAVISNGTTIFDAGAIDSGQATGNMTLIKTLTASSSGTLSFVHGASSVVFNNTYDSYLFTFINIHPATNQTKFQFNMSVDTGSNYNVTKTTTNFRAYHEESGGSPAVGYHRDEDLAQATGFQSLGYDIGNGSDESASGSLQIFSPSSTTFVKHFIAICHQYNSGDYAVTSQIAGYGNTTSAVDGIQFKMNSGNIDTGTIKMYGIK